jgi:hypothetical protein
METKTYRARFGTTNLKATIHSDTCAVAVNQKGKKYVCFDVEAATARDAAQAVYDGQDFADRGLKFPTICECAK